MLRSRSLFPLSSENLKNLANKLHVTHTEDNSEDSCAITLKNPKERGEEVKPGDSVELPASGRIIVGWGFSNTEPTTSPTTTASMSNFRTPPTRKRGGSGGESTLSNSSSSHLTPPEKNNTTTTTPSSSSIARTRLRSMRVSKSYDVLPGPVLDTTQQKHLGERYLSAGAVLYDKWGFTLCTVDSCSHPDILASYGCMHRTLRKKCNFKSNKSNSHTIHNPLRHSPSSSSVSSGTPSPSSSASSPLPCGTVGSDGYLFITNDNSPDVEQISVQLDTDAVAHVIFVVCAEVPGASRGHKEQAYMRVVDASEQRELYRVNLGALPTGRICLTAELFHEDSPTLNTSQTSPSSSSPSPPPPAAAAVPTITVDSNQQEKQQDNEHSDDSIQNSEEELTNTRQQHDGGWYIMPQALIHPFSPRHSGSCLENTNLLDQFLFHTDLSRLGHCRRLPSAIQVSIPQGKEFKPGSIYCEVGVNSWQHSEKFRSQVFRREPKPQFNLECTFRIDKGYAASALVVTVYEKGMIKEKVLGSVMIPFRLLGEEKGQWFTLERRGQPVGKIQVCAQFVYDTVNYAVDK